MPARAKGRNGIRTLVAASNIIRLVSCYCDDANPTCLFVATCTVLNYDTILRQAAKLGQQRLGTPKARLQLVASKRLPPSKPFLLHRSGISCRFAAAGRWHIIKTSS